MSNLSLTCSPAVLIKTKSGVKHPKHELSFSGRLLKKKNDNTADAESKERDGDRRTDAGRGRPSVCKVSKGTDGKSKVSRLKWFVSKHKARWRIKSN